MKRILWIIFFLATGTQFIFAQVGIGTENPHASAALEIQSTEMGLLIPRLIEVQRNRLPNPATGLLIFQTDKESGFYYFDGESWVMLKAGEYVSPDWDANAGAAAILNKPDLAAIALSGQFGDLENVPDYLTVEDTASMLLPYVTLAKITSLLKDRAALDDLTEETEERKTADLSLTTALETETAERMYEDASLVTALANETSERISNDTNLETAVANETARAQAAEAEKEVLANKSIDITTDGES
ncbi:hypothetical protein G9Q97_24615, partial [Cyclobacterium sp. GBPx2]|nr:hypothetical protein [Cyclobacterium plantarum]